MRILLTTTILFFLAWVAHLGIWRIRLPKHHIRALLLIFTSIFGFWLMFFARTSMSLTDGLQTALLYFSICLCYVITYSAIEGDSPTLSLMNLLAEKKDAGLAADEMAGFLSHRPFIKARLAALVHSGLVREENKRLLIAGRPSLSFRIVLGFRKLYGSTIPKGG